MAKTFDADEYRKTTEKIVNDIYRKLLDNPDIDSSNINGEIFREALWEVSRLEDKCKENYTVIRDHDDSKDLKDGQILTSTPYRYSNKCEQYTTKYMDTYMKGQKFEHYKDVVQEDRKANQKTNQKAFIMLSAEDTERLFDIADNGGKLSDDDMNLLEEYVKYYKLPEDIRIDSLLLSDTMNKPYSTWLLEKPLNSSGVEKIALRTLMRNEKTEDLSNIHICLSLHFAYFKEKLLRETLKH